VQRTAWRSGLKAQVLLPLPGGQPLPGDRLPQLQSCLVMRRADVLNLP
jgi:hypothetical protein